MTARWGKPQRRQVGADGVSPTPTAPRDDLARLIDRRFTRDLLAATSGTQTTADGDLEENAR